MKSPPVPRACYQIKPLHVIYFIRDLDGISEQASELNTHLFEWVYEGLACGEIARVLVVTRHASTPIITEWNELGVAVDVIQRRGMASSCKYIRSLKWLLLAEPYWVLHATCDFSYALASYMAFSSNTPRVIWHCLKTSKLFTTIDWWLWQFNRWIYPGMANHVVFTSAIARVQSQQNGIARVRTHLLPLPTTRWRDLYKLYHQTFDHTLFAKENMALCREMPMTANNKRKPHSSRLRHHG